MLVARSVAESAMQAVYFSALLRAAPLDPEALWVGFRLLVVFLAFTLLLVMLNRLKALCKSRAGFWCHMHSGEIVGLLDVGELTLSYWMLTVSCIVVYGCVPWNNIEST